jgi:uncharacterized protein (DUF433 family)
MDWHDHIHTDPEILGGKPVVKGTRLSVDFILSLLAVGWSEAQVFEGYPHLTRDDLQAIFAYASESVQDERLVQVY